MFSLVFKYLDISDGLIKLRCGLVCRMDTEIY